jgi:hypothetical protein
MVAALESARLADKGEQGMGGRMGGRMGGAVEDNEEGGGETRQSLATRVTLSKVGSMYRAY